MAREKSYRIAVPASEDTQAGGDNSENIAFETGNETDNIGNEASGISGESDTSRSTGDSGNEYTASDTALGDDDEYIRDEAGNLTYSPTGRVRKRRKRRSGAPGSTAGGSKAREKVSLNELKENVETNAALLYSSHFVIAKVTAPEMELNANEATMLSEAITPILMRSGVQAPAWVKDVNNIVLAFSYVYAPRFKMIGDRMKAEKAAKAEAHRRGQQVAVAPMAGNPVPDVFHTTIDPNAGPLGGLQ